MQRKRFEYWQSVQGILAKDLIFIDEAGVNLAMTRLFARAPKGQRARGKRPNKRGQNVSMIGAISLTGIVTQLPILGGCDLFLMWHHLGAIVKQWLVAVKCRVQ